MIVVSGGQTGVDRAALDAAFATGVNVTGWCPQGRLAEDGPLSIRYPLCETTTPYYVQRTRLNVRDSEATLVLVFRRLHGGTALTADFAWRMGKPLHVVDLARTPRPSAATFAWLEAYQPARLNIAGPRDGGSGLIYDRAFVFCHALLLQHVHLLRST